MIRVLSESLVNKIAAGEVIVRPASVVKELVENSLDAGATTIRVELSNAARDIRVTDDGHGIAPDDAPLALVRHATSKISEFDDLYALSTRGFRGEALASIASVAHITILSRPAASQSGIKIENEGRNDVRIEAAGAPPGTDIRVRDLFYNTPARLKFLKAATAEVQHAVVIVTRQALVKPHVGFTFVSEGRTILDLPPHQPWDERITAILGSQVEGQLLDVDHAQYGIHVRGYVVRPLVSRKDRRNQFFSVNSRPITSRTLSFSLLEACKGVIMVQRHPMAVLDLTIPSHEVDVNVHPTKEEVRFRNESAVAGAIFRAVQTRLNSANLMPTLPLGGDHAPTTPQRPADTTPDFALFTSPARTVSGQPVIASDLATLALAREAAATPSITPVSPDTPHVFDAAESTPAPTETTAAPCERHLPASAAAPDSATGGSLAAFLPAGLVPDPLGQVDRCFIIARAASNLLLIDQHAAHERLMYMHLTQRRSDLNSQPLLVPVSINIPAAAQPFMADLIPELSRVGIEIEPFGGSTYLVQSVPADLPKLNVAALIADLVDEFTDNGRPTEVGAVRDRIVTRMACRAAIKSGQELSMEEMRALLSDIVQSQMGFTCPHGRPTMILLSRDQLDHYFRRKV